MDTRYTFQVFFGELWDSTQASEKSATRSSVQIKNDLDYGNKIYKNRIFSAQQQETFARLLNQEAQKEIFSKIKGLNYKSQPFEFGSVEWFKIFYKTMTDQYPFGYRRFSDVGVEDFFIALREPTALDFRVYLKKWKDKGYPFLDQRQNEFLRSSAPTEWLKAARPYYQGFFRKFAKIYLITDPKLPNAPQYRLKRSLGIASDQNVYLAEDLATRNEVVVKWDADIERGLDNWEDVRNNGVDMLDFKTGYKLHYYQKVLVMEKLYQINGTDSLYVLALDVLSQLQQLHRIPGSPRVHSDLKLDNILKRISPDGKRKYFIIDWDNISNQALVAIPNTSVREAYSPYWTSQVPGLFHPTSYRYDLQELFYALVDLKKKQITLERRQRGLEVPDFMADADELQRRKVPLRDIIKQMHLDNIPDDRYLTNLFAKFLSLPERLPTEEIGYQEIIDYVREGLEKYGPDPKKVRGQFSSTMQQEGHTCVRCTNPVVHARTIEDLEGKKIYVCGPICAALENPEYEEEALEIRRISGKVRMRCSVCRRPTTNHCVCKVLYCSEKCQQKDWPRHSEFCTEKQESFMS